MFIQVATIATTDLDEGSNAAVTYTLTSSIPGTILPFSIGGKFRIAAVLEQKVASWRTIVNQLAHISVKLPQATILVAQD